MSEARTKTGVVDDEFRAAIDKCFKGALAREEERIRDKTAELLQELGHEGTWRLFMDGKGKWLFEYQIGPLCASCACPDIAVAVDSFRAGLVDDWNRNVIGKAETPEALRRRAVLLEHFEPVPEDDKP